MNSKNSAAKQAAKNVASIPATLPAVGTSKAELDAAGTVTDRPETEPEPQKSDGEGHGQKTYSR